MINRLQRGLERILPSQGTLDAFADVAEARDDAALDRWERLARRRPAVAASLIRRLTHLQRESRAQEVLDEALRRWPRDRRLLAEKARLARHRWAPLSHAHALLASGEKDAARAAFIEALGLVGERIPMDGLARVLVGIGWAERAAGRATEALAAFERAERVAPDLLDAAYGAGLSLRDLGREREARVRLARAAGVNPAAPGPISSIGWCHYDAGRLGPAERAFRAALRLHPGDADALWGFAWCVYRRARGIHRGVAPVRSAIPEPNSGPADDSLPGSPSVSQVLEAFAKAVPKGGRRSLEALLRVMKRDESLHGLIRAFARSALDEGAHDLAEEAAWITLDEEILAEVLVAAGRQAELLDRPAPCPMSPRLASLRVRAALAGGLHARAREEARRAEPPLRERLLGEVFLAEGRLEEALASFVSAVEEGDAAARGLLPDLRLRVARLPLSRWGDEDELLRGATDTAALPGLIAHARRHFQEGRRDAASRLLDALPPEASTAVREELFPTPRPRTGRGHLAAKLAGLEVEANPADDIHGRAACLLERKPTRRRLRAMRGLLERAPEDPLLQETFRRMAREIEA